MKKQLFWHTKPRTSHNDLFCVRDFHTFFITSSYSFCRQRSNPGHSLHDEDDENNSDEDETSKEGAAGSSSEIHTGKFNTIPPSLNSERAQKKFATAAAAEQFLRLSNTSLFYRNKTLFNLLLSAFLWKNPRHLQPVIAKFDLSL